MDPNATRAISFLIGKIDASTLKDRINPHFGQFRKNLSNWLDTGQRGHMLGARLFLAIVLVQGMIPNGKAYRNSAKILPYNGHQKSFKLIGHRTVLSHARCCTFFVVRFGPRDDSERPGLQKFCKKTCHTMGTKSLYLFGNSAVGRSLCFEKTIVTSANVPVLSALTEV